MVPLRVLLVEDEHLIRWLAAEALRDEGFEVLEASDGDEAVSQLRDPDHVDVLFTDVRMPGELDGIALAMRAREMSPGLPVIVATAYASQVAIRLEALNPPAHFLRKPYSIREIADIVRQAAA
ncbi:response regulator [Acidisoma cladoniae]|jgi:CheY-like chemotaxis protein|uniref:response regulator n=1 Tax=Acidisoma cladoniae TaxID=3040935 RepID=UPI00254DD74D|nr:response regulator [Acidisoma sp. PAMC 29798]